MTLERQKSSGVAQLGERGACNPEGHRFESYRPIRQVAEW